MEKGIKLGISACLLGQKVRYDGGHRLDRFLSYTLGQYVEYVPVCPEVECGLGTPREAMRLVGDPESPRLVTKQTNQDHTERMLDWANRRVIELDGEGLCGFIFKGNSPSSGMQRVRVYNEGGGSVKNGSGIFARIFMEHFPLIPVEDEGRLHDPKLRENFIERIFALRSWRKVIARKWSIENLVGFHTENKLLILSHSKRHYGSMEKMVATGKERSIRELYEGYEDLLMEALRLNATTRKNTNVLKHMMGYFKKRLSADERHELVEIIRQYSNGQTPLIVPITLINHYVQKYKQPYLSRQTYLKPHPIALLLRNHVKGDARAEIALR